MAKEVIDDNGVTETILHDDGDGLVMEHRQDVEGILKQNKALQNTEINKKAVGRHAAQIPMIIWDLWMKEFRKTRGYTYERAKPEEREAFLSAKLNDPDNAFLRTWQGKV